MQKLYTLLTNTALKKLLIYHLIYFTKITEIFNNYLSVDNEHSLFLSLINLHVSSCTACAGVVSKAAISVCRSVVVSLPCVDDRVVEGEGCGAAEDRVQSWVASTLKYQDLRSSSPKCSMNAAAEPVLCQPVLPDASTGRSSVSIDSSWASLDSVTSGVGVSSPPSGPSVDRVQSSHDINPTRATSWPRIVADNDLKCRVTRNAVIPNRSVSLDSSMASLDEESPEVVTRERRSRLQHQPVVIRRRRLSLYSNGSERNCSLERMVWRDESSSTSDLSALASNNCSAVPSKHATSFLRIVAENDLKSRKTETTSMSRDSRSVSLNSSCASLDDASSVSLDSSMASLDSARGTNSTSPKVVTRRRSSRLHHCPFVVRRRPLSLYSNGSARNCSLERMVWRDERDSASDLSALVSKNRRAAKDSNASVSLNSSAATFDSDSGRSGQARSIVVKSQHPSKPVLRHRPRSVSHPPRRPVSPIRRDPSRVISWLRIIAENELPRTDRVQSQTRRYAAFVEPHFKCFIVLNYLQTHDKISLMTLIYFLLL
jgi:hypothetical protein